MTLQEMADQVRRVADEIEGMRDTLCVPVQEMTLKEAWTRLEAGGIKDRRLSMELRRYDFEEAAVASFEVWDGKKTHTAPTLAGAVNAALAANAPQPEEPLAVAQTLLDDAAQPSIPF